MRGSAFRPDLQLNAYKPRLGTKLGTVAPYRLARENSPSRAFFHHDRAAIRASSNGCNRASIPNADHEGETSHGCRGEIKAADPALIFRRFPAPEGQRV